MKVAIYQIIPELDNSRMLFNSLEYMKKAHDGRVLAEIYEMIFCGEIDAEDCEDVFRIFNTDFPQGYKGRSLSVSDVVEIIGSDGKSEFYFCDTIGFERIKFRKEKAMTLVLNHNYDCVQEKQENVSVFFIGQNGIEQVKCKSFEFTRCKYSETQLGYRIRCNTNDGKNLKFDFLDRPSIILSNCLDTFPKSLLYIDEKTTRYSVHSKENLGIVCTWLHRKGYNVESFYGGCKYEVLYRRKRKHRP